MTSSICAVPNELTWTYFRDLRHISAVGRLVKNDINSFEGGGNCFSIAQIAFHKLRCRD